MDITNAEITNVFNFATTQAKAIVDLAYIHIGICLLFLVTVVGLTAYAVLKFRHREGDPEPEQHEGNLKLEIIWTVIPTLIFAYLGVLTGLVMYQVNPPVRSRQPDLIVTGHQFWWEYKYPKTGLVTANEFFIPVNADLLFEIRGADVIHSFWVPCFGQKMDGIPGHPNKLFLKPIKKGIFLGQCAEYCGDQHGLMRIIANVVEPKDFEKWQQSQLKVPAAPNDEAAKHGQELFMSRTCVQCHAIAGTAATARVAPDLTHLADRKSIGAGVIANNLENLSQWIKDPQKFKPGCYMPKMMLTEREAHDIAYYLENLK